MSYFTRLRKHGRGSHDEADHGNWARGSGGWGPDDVRFEYGRVGNVVTGHGHKLQKEYESQFRQQLHYASQHGYVMPDSVRVLPYFPDHPFQRDELNSRAEVLNPSYNMGDQATAREQGITLDHDGDGLAIRVDMAIPVLRGKLVTRAVVERELKRHGTWRTTEGGARERHWAGQTMNDMFFHEMTHVMHYNTLLKAAGVKADASPTVKYQALAKMTSGFGSDTKVWSPEFKAFLRKHVSNYAATDPMEFVAETAVALRNGEKMPETIMTMYRKMHGPEVKS